LLLGNHFANTLGVNGRYLLGQAHLLRTDNLTGLRELLVGNLEVILMTLAPLAGALLVAAVGANVAQVGLRVTPKAMAPKLEKLNPITGMKKFFQKRALFELVKHLIKITVIAWLAYVTIAALMEELGAMPLLNLPDLLAVGRSGFLQLVSRLVALMFLLAIIDWTWQRYDFEQNLKMSKYEVRQDTKDIEGDPQIKARIRGLQMEMARKRMLAQVPEADVVITNPTHYAVALQYERGTPAPIVVAKGRDHVAAVIRKIARRARVPVIENKPVARALYEQVEVGRGIPESLYQVVAEILAYVYRLKRA
jgi:flagellar biosynthetic protein FlhB